MVFLFLLFKVFLPSNVVVSHLQGLPHAHIAIKMYPEPMTVRQLDSVVSCTFPQFTDSSNVKLVITSEQEQNLKKRFFAEKDNISACGLNWISSQFYFDPLFDGKHADLCEQLGFVDTSANLEIIKCWWNVNFQQQVIRRTGLVHSSCNKSCKGVTNCKRGYPHGIRNKTEIDGRGFVQWKRPNVQSNIVVPHNMALSLLAGNYIHIRFLNVNKNALKFSFD